MSKIKVLAHVSNPNSGVYFHRIVNPLNYILGEFDIKFIDLHNGMPLSDLEWADVLIISRALDNEASVTKEWLDRYNVKLIVDIDDSPIIPDNHHYKGNIFTGYYIDYLKIADLVWVTNNTLKEFSLQYNNKVDIIPNGLPFGYDQFSEFNPKFNGKVGFMYSANLVHYNDAELLKGAIKSVNKQPLFQNRFTFSLLGRFKSKAHIDNKLWDKMEDIFNSGKRNNPNFISIPLKGVSEYMYSVGLGSIGVAPLVDNTFNKCKSNLKILEYASKKMPCIISGVSSQITDNPPCIVAKNTKDWIDAFMYYMQDESRIVEDGEALNRWAKNNFDIKQTNYKRVNSINNLFI